MSQRSGMAVWLCSTLTLAACSSGSSPAADANGDVTSPPRRCTPAASLELCLDFEDATASGVPDASGSKRVGAVKGAVIFADGRYGKGAKLPGDNSAYVDFGDVLHLVGPLTLEAWVDVPAGAKGWDTIVSSWTNWQGYWLGLSKLPPQPGTTEPRRGGFELWIGQAYLASSGDATPGWHHVAGTYEHDSGEMVLYVDGREAARDTAFYSGDIQSSDINLTLGKGGDSFSPLTGVVDEVRIWSSLRTPAQICESAGCSGRKDGGVDGIPPIDPGVQRIIDELAKLRANQSADLDGDGVQEYQVGVVSGVVEWRVDKDHDGVAEYLRTWDPSTKTVVESIDADQDGFAEIETTTEPDQRVILKDTDGDQVHDWRRTDTYDWKGKTGRTVIETAPKGDGDFAVVSDTTSSLKKAKCPPPPSGGGDGGAACDSYIPVGAPNRNLGLPNVNTYDTGTKQDTNARCSTDHVAKIAKAIQCAVSRTMECLANTNMEEARRMLATMVTGSLNVSCGACAGALAGYSPSGPATSPNGDMSWSPADLEKMTDAAACSAAMHEMMHWAGSPDSGADHDAGDDLVHSCSRYCGGEKGCTYTNENHPKDCGISGPRDCAACGGSPAEKLKCGYRKEQVTGTTLMGVCHRAFDICTCTDVKVLEKQYCDKTPIGAVASSGCCNSCPGNCNDYNDYPCQSIPPEDQCGAPFCK